MRNSCINKLSGGLFLGLCASTSILSAALPEPCAPGAQLKAPAAQPSDLTVKVELVGTMPTVGDANNLASPVAYSNDEMFLIDQANANIYSYCASKKISQCDNGSRINQIFYTIDLPPGLGIPGGNRGTGLEICRQRAGKGHRVIMGSDRYGWPGCTEKCREGRRYRSLAD